MTMPYNYEHEDLVKALEEHTKALNKYVSMHEYPNNVTNNETTVINYTGLLQDIDSRLKEIKDKLPDKPLKY